MPPHVRDPWRHAQLHFDTTGRCAYCEMVEGELEARRACRRETRALRLLRPLCREDAVRDADLPQAAPRQLLLAERRARSRTWPRSCKDRCCACGWGCSNPDYNFVIRSAGSGDEDVRHLHWYFVIIPKITTPAGFEIGSGIYINMVPPESAAEYLRGVQTEA